MKGKSIVVFGDSILKGVVTNPESDRIFDVTENNSLALAQKELGFELDNRSIYGNIITKGQLKFNKWLEKGGKADICIIEFGGNDCDYDWAPISENPKAAHQAKVPLADYMRILDQMVKDCREHKITPLLMTMPALVADCWLETVSKGLSREKNLEFLDGDYGKLYRNHEIYNTHLLKYAYENKVQFVDMRLAILESPNYRNLMCKDGIHPNEAGYRLMADLWIKELPKVKLEF
ncbi:MAG: SGNH/GDSL hydrolase family protein [Treponema sp.]|nr:SGNH/GDSL hydrolase family protein [Treponema sp.]